MTNKLPRCTLPRYLEPLLRHQQIYRDVAETMLSLHAPATSSEIHTRMQNYQPNQVARAIKVYKDYRLIEMVDKRTNQTPPTYRIFDDLRTPLEMRLARLAGGD